MWSWISLDQGVLVSTALIFWAGAFFVGGCPVHHRTLTASRDPAHQMPQIVTIKDVSRKDQIWQAGLG